MERERVLDTDKVYEIDNQLQEELRQKQTYEIEIESLNANKGKGKQPMQKKRKGGEKKNFDDMRKGLAGSKRTSAKVNIPTDDHKDLEKGL